MAKGAIVLVVDDSTDNRSMYCEYLAYEGFRVLEAPDAATAMAIARRDSPDVVIMDVGLPGVDGVEATRMLRADSDTRDVLILALSGHGTDAEARVMEAGADLFVRKP